MSGGKEFDAAILKPWGGGSECPEPSGAKVWPIYRGPANPELGIRFTCAVAGRLDWSHDGGDDDIVGYRVAHSDAISAAGSTTVQ